LKAMTQLDDYIFIKIWRPIIKQNREEHLKFIKDNKLEDKVFFIDFVETNEDLVKFYNIADIFVFPSLFEWFWRPPIEAQACGCPVISSDKWGLKEVLEDSAIILENPEDTKELLWKIPLTHKIKEKFIQLWLKNVKRFSLEFNIDFFENLL
jgi:glycosyltransferase involved in cell wall biosynthesis